MIRSTWLYLDLVKFHEENGGRACSQGNYCHRVGEKYYLKKKKKEKIVNKRTREYKKTIVTGRT